MNKTTGFGHCREREPHHFVVLASRVGNDVQVYEVFREDDDGPQLDAVNLRCVIGWDRWARISDFVADEFNRRLRDQKLKTGRWKPGMNTVSRLLGKELALLAWAIEEAEQDQIGSALTNWQGLAPEERWWLYTMTAAQTGNATRDRDRGWRRALRFALCDNPVNVVPITASTPERKGMLKRHQEAAAQQSTLWRAKLATA